MVCNWWTLFEFTILSIDSTNTHTHDTQNTIDIRMYIPQKTHHIILKTLGTSWCIYGSQAMHTVLATIPGVYFCIHTTLYTNDYRYQDGCLVHKWGWPFEFTIQSVYTHLQQCSNYNSYHDACVVHKWCTLFESDIAIVYSTCTHHIIPKLPLPSGCIPVSQEMHTVRGHYVMCVIQHTHIHIT